MLSLSRRGWNNVLIFSTLFMIFLFNGLHHKLLDNTDKSMIKKNLLPATELILTLDLPGISIERVGRGWRSVPEKNLSTEQLQQIMVNWQSLEVKTLMPDQSQPFTNQQPDKVAVFWFAGQTQGFVVQWFQLNERTLVNTPNGWFELLNIENKQLFIPVLSQDA
ncbi:hypothetical protein N7931_18360 [Catenovulum sp. 2E275]|uniref:hypothetical protein n=1 Tax=Catenovulum sp. 2E275 TaxID=2980497 RepID=UPI0021D04C2B|nr:hypothetical protein [Catenovulum sp. 2E275]MCU4677585.1 hypothetical protein [Catenovulum sp. 2E275]